MREFNDGVANIEVEDVNSTGLHFTWNQKPREERGILKKTDRVMSNIDFNNSFPGSYAIFQPYRILDHAHAVLKKAWEAVGSDVCNAVQDFFLNGKLLKEVNHTIIALLPKVSTPSRVNDYRLSSCCYVIYKCISKIITNRIKDGLDDIVSENQLAFVPGWSILDNILLTQELMHTYHLNKGQPCCAIKIDIQKAYDTVS
ncbi:putative RNA-directed DNA polymerase, eukaryota, reverse transcriptase zinc-binding domain protein [Tanacetum coccineum]